MDIKSCDIIVTELDAHGITAYPYHSALSARDKTRNLAGFKNESAGILVSPKMLDEGINIPDAEIGINMASTLSKLQLIQRMGRILRRSTDEAKPKNPVFYHFISTTDPIFKYLTENNFIRLNDKEWIHTIISDFGEQITVKTEKINKYISHQSTSATESINRGKKSSFHQMLIEKFVNLLQLGEETIINPTDFSIDDVKPDILWKKKYCIEILHETISQQEMERRFRIYRSQDLTPVWIFYQSNKPTKKDSEKRNFGQFSGYLPHYIYNKSQNSKLPADFGIDHAFLLTASKYRRSVLKLSPVEILLGKVHSGLFYMSLIDNDEFIVNFIELIPDINKPTHFLAINDFKITNAERFHKFIRISTTSNKNYHQKTAHTINIAKLKKKRKKKRKKKKKWSKPRYPRKSPRLPKPPNLQKLGIITTKEMKKLHPKKKSTSQTKKEPNLKSQKAQAKLKEKTKTYHCELCNYHFISYKMYLKHLQNHVKKRVD